MTKLTFRASIVRVPPSVRLSNIRIIDSSRCLFSYDNKSLSVLIYGIQGGEAKVGEKTSCELDFLNGTALKNILSKGDSFNLMVANEVIAIGTVEEIISCSNLD